MYCLKTDDPFVQIPIKAMKIPSECDKQTPRSSPTMQGGGGEGGRWGGPPPTTHRGPTLCRGWASVHGGQTPISPQVLTKDSGPPPLSHQCTMRRLGSMIPLYKLVPRTIYRGIKNSTVHIQGNIRFPCICTGEFSIPLYNYRGTISLYVFLLRVVQCRVLAWILETFDHTGLEE